MAKTGVRAQLDAFKKDKTKKLVEKRVDHQYAHYEFQDGEMIETDREVKTNFIRVFLDFENPDRDRISKSSRGGAKFLCVNGPQAGRRETIQNVGADYVLFNNGAGRHSLLSRRRGRGLKLATAVFVHIDSILE